MQDDLRVRRRVLAVTYQRYVEADLSWIRACQAARDWFPADDRPYRRAIGDPSSPIRRIYERRQRALVQLMAARLKLKQAQRRLEKGIGGNDARRQHLRPSLKISFVM